MKPKLKILLANAAPDIAFSVEHEEDPHYTWDGEGPDPRDEGYAAYDVTVTARTIVGGQVYNGNAYLGGVYEFWGPQGPKKPDPDIHGYLPQMIQEALDGLKDRLINQSLLSARLKKEIAAAHEAASNYSRQLQESYAR